MTFITVKGSPRTSLTVLFLAWKVILLTIALVSPGPGYDTSTKLLFKGHGIQDVELPLREVYSDSPSHAPTPGLPFLVGRLLQALTRWDAIFFVSVAERGYNFEQEWAFGWGFLRAYLPFATKSMLVSLHLPHDDIIRLRCCLEHTFSCFVCWE
jgi:phosphatidylinositol glycan class V